MKVFWKCVANKYFLSKLFIVKVPSTYIIGRILFFYFNLLLVAFQKELFKLVSELI